MRQMSRSARVIIAAVVLALVLAMPVAFQAVSASGVYGNDRAFEARADQNTPVNLWLIVLPLWIALIVGAALLYFGLRARRRAKAGQPTAMGRTGGTIAAAIGVVAIAAVLLVAAAPTGFVQGGNRWTNSWAGDFTCGYGFTAVDCWASNQSLNINGPGLTVTDSEAVVQSGSGAIDADDIAFTFTVKNEGPAQFNGLGQEVAQPIYAQVTSVDTIVSNQGVPLPIVQVNSVNQLMIAWRDCSSNSAITEQRQTTLGTLASGASCSPKLNIQLRYQAFAACIVDPGAAYHIRGYIDSQSFDITVYVATVTSGC
jgi:heme/copper-type cytochrome/quinol oxidase subunit 2